MSQETGVTPAVLAAAREHFGFSELRPGQAEAIDAVLGGQDTLAVFPTGAGKSAIYQLSGIARPGATVVVSPLIALQKDQVDSLRAIDEDAAAGLHGQTTPRQSEEALERLAEGSLEFIFVTPEQLQRPDTVERLREIRPSLFVVDEAHCVSTWGHDFRPAYAALGAVIEALGHPTVLALTATAARPVREEIIERLGMRDPRVLVRGFDRPNLFLRVERFCDAAEKQAALLETVAALPKPGIVYAGTRKETERIAEALLDRGLRASAYHAGMSGSARTEAQDAFMADELDVIVATVAFGMGIDKPNVRFVAHATISESLDAYAQECGRAGRDGEPAEAVLFYHPDDLGLRRFQAGGGTFEPETIAAVATFAAKRRRTTLDRIATALDVPDGVVERVVTRLAGGDGLTLEPGGSVTVKPGFRVDAAVEEAVSEQERRHAVSRSRVEMMRQYADAPGCRRELLLGYFGEPFAPPCGFCDNCHSGATVPASADVRPFALGGRVEHQTWGAGEVLRYEGDKMVVLFDDTGYRTLLADHVVQEGILRAAVP